MAAFDYFLKLDGIPGESVDAKHKGEIDVLSWSWGESQEIAATPGGAVAYARALARLEELRMPLPLPHDPLRLVPAADHRRRIFWETACRILFPS